MPKYTLAQEIEAIEEEIENLKRWNLSVSRFISMCIELELKKREKCGQENTAREEPQGRYN